MSRTFERPHRSRRHLLSGLLVVALAVVGCGDDGDVADGQTVVATTTILGDVVRNVAGDGVSVEVVLPVGADPHDFQPSSQQIAAIESADLVVANGLGLEESLEDILEGLEDVPVLTVGDGVDPLPFLGSAEEEDEEGDHDDDEHSLDPHIWMDPVRMIEVVNLVESALTDAFPGEDFSAAAERYRSSLSDTDERIAAILADIPADRRVLITNHDALGYFAARYDFEVVGTVIPGGSTLADPSSAQMAALVDVIEERRIPAIFAETLDSRALTDVLAAEVGDRVEVVELFTGSLGGPGSGAETLIDLLITDAETIAAALAP